MGKYQRYPEYRSSGVEWLGYLPVCWGTSSIKNWLSESPCYGVLKPDKYEGDDAVPVIRIMDVSNGRVQLETLEKISPQMSREYSRTLIKAGDLIVSVVGTLGRTFVCCQIHEGMNISRALARLQVKRKKSTKYIEYLINSKCFIDYVSVTCNGAAQKVLNMEDISNWAVPLPTLKEQAQIAAFLDHETAKIDTLIEKQQTLIALLEEKRQAVISHAVTKGLNPDVPMRDTGVEWLKEVPRHWVISQLKYEVEAGTSITYGIVQAGPHIENGIPYIKTSDMAGDELPIEGYSKTSTEIASAYQRSKVRCGDIVIAIRATVGKCLLVPKELEGANLTQGTAKVSPSQNLNVGYLLSYLSSSQVQSHFESIAKGATFREITLDMLRRVPVLIPPISEQKGISDKVNEYYFHYGKLINASAKQMVLLTERRTALISAAVTGKIDVRNWQTPEQNQTNTVDAA